MPAEMTPVSLRLPPETRARLDKAAARMRRSRSFLMQEALERHLDAIERENGGQAGGRHLKTLLALGGAGQRADDMRTADEVQHYTNWLRGNDQDR